MKNAITSTGTLWFVGLVAALIFGVAYVADITILDAIENIITAVVILAAACMAYFLARYSRNNDN